MLNLPQVTLCCVDTRQPTMALGAMRLCMEQVNFGAALLITGPRHQLDDLPAGLNVIPVDHINSIEAYSHFLLKELVQYVTTSHVLIVQWDGYILDAALWTDDFLNVDYIGAVWPQYDDRHRVGNGGFSLRSRKLLHALTAPEIEPHHPEDVCIARTYRRQLEREWGIRFADETMANRFAVEREPSCGATFGFHGLSNLARFMPAEQIPHFLQHAPKEIFASLEARGFIKNLIKRRLTTDARTALRLRMRSRRLNLSDLRLWLRAYLA